MSEFNLPEVAWIDERKQVTTTQAMDAYLQPAIEQAERIRAKYRDALTKAIVGEHTAKEVEPGVWEHTFTPSYALSCALPQITAVEAHRAINRIMSDVNYSKSLRRVVREERVKKRARRQHRAAFRRRKRGLA